VKVKLLRTVSAKYSNAQKRLCVKKQTWRIKHQMLITKSSLIVHSK